MLKTQFQNEGHVPPKVDDIRGNLSLNRMNMFRLK